jgi:curved DNA-binding protein CbpA
MALETVPEWRGTLSRNTLPQLLRQIFLEHRTGTLTLAGPEETHHFFFEAGEFRTATSSREGQRLGAFLKRRGVISDQELEAALASIGGPRRTRFGKLLIEKGYVTQAVLYAEMHRLVEEIVFSTFTWERGEFVFRDSKGKLDPDVILDLSTAGVVVEGIRRLPESEEFAVLLGDLDRAAVIAEDPTSRYQYLSLAPHEALLLSRCDGVTPMRDLLKMGNSRLESAKVLYALMACGLIEPVAVTASRRDRRETPLQDLNIATAAAEELKRNEDAAAVERHRKLIRETYRRIDWISLYDLLGVDQHASIAELDSAYHERSRLFHPDLKFREGLRDLGKELDVLYSQVQQAYRRLADPETRGTYDRESLEQAGDLSTDPDEATRLGVARANYLEARKLMEVQDYYGAILLLQEAVRLTPENGEYHFRLAGALSKNRNWRERAIVQYREAARLDPYRKDLLQEFCEFLLSISKQTEAEEIARTLTHRWPDDKGFKDLLAKAQAPPAPQSPADLFFRQPVEDEKPILSQPGRGSKSLISRLFKKD